MRATLRIFCLVAAFALIFGGVAPRAHAFVDSTSPAITAGGVDAVAASQDETSECAPGVSCCAALCAAYAPLAPSTLGPRLLGARPISLVPQVLTGRTREPDLHPPRLVRA